MKKLILFVCTFGVFSQYTYAWDTTAAKYYPLAVGNIWSYHDKIFQPPLGCTTPTSQFDHIVSIVKDTVFNSHRYFKFSDGRRERIDSVKMNVYRFTGSSECIVDSLLARKNDYYSSCPWTKQVVDTNSISFAGQNWSSKGISGMPGYMLRLVKGLGVYQDFFCELGSGTDNTLNGCIINGIQYGNIIIGVKPTGNKVPDIYSISQNYPNPFNPLTIISFQLSKSGNTKLIIYDVLGKEVATLVNEQLNLGSYEVQWDGSEYTSGMYFYKLISGDFIETKKMVLIK